MEGRGLPRDGEDGKERTIIIQVEQKEMCMQISYNNLVLIEVNKRGVGEENYTTPITTQSL